MFTLSKKPRSHHRVLAEKTGGESADWRFSPPISRTVNKKEGENHRGRKP